MKAKFTITGTVYSDLAVLVTGISTNIEEVKKSFSGYDIIFSTWEKEREKYNDGEIVVYNKIPSINGPHNFFLQKECSLNGLKFCKKMKYQKILKIRSDLIPTNADRFIKLLDFDKINFLCSHKGNSDSGPYYVDYMMGAKIEHLIHLWEVDDVRDTDFVEQILTRRIVEYMNNIPINLILNEINNDNDLIWMKYGINISEYKKHECYK